MQRAEPIASAEKEVWNRHWRALQRSPLFGRMASLVRRSVLRRAVRHYASRWLPRDGWLVETGCGTGEASQLVPREGRRLVGVDLSLSVLLAGRGSGPYDCRLVADIRRLPFADGSIAGTWNLGVLEHFEEAEGIAILRELRRVLRRGGIAVLFWPPSFGSSRLALAPVEAARSVLTGRRFRFFPDEVNRLRSRRHGRAVLQAAGLEPLRVDFTPRDAWIHMVLVGARSDQAPPAQPPPRSSTT